MSLIVDLYSWVGKEEGYDGCVAFHSGIMQRGPATLQKQRSRQRGEGHKEINEKEGEGRSNKGGARGSSVVTQERKAAALLKNSVAEIPTR